VSGSEAEWGLESLSPLRRKAVRNRNAAPHGKKRAQGAFLEFPFYISPFVRGTKKSQTVGLAENARSCAFLEFLPSFLLARGPKELKRRLSVRNPLRLSF